MTHLTRNEENENQTCFVDDDDVERRGKDMAISVIRPFLVIILEQIKQQNSVNLILLSFATTEHDGFSF